MNLAELKNIVDMDISTFYDKNMVLIPESKLTKNQKACIKKIDYETNSLELLDKLDALANIQQVLKT